MTSVIGNYLILPNLEGKFIQMSQPHTVKKEKRKWNSTSKNNSGFIWFLGFIGAFIYYVEQVDNFGAGIIAFLKALVWPAFLVYKLLG